MPKLMGDNPFESDQVAEQAFPNLLPNTSADTDMSGQNRVAAPDSGSPAGNSMGDFNDSLSVTVNEEAESGVGAASADSIITGHVDGHNNIPMYEFPPVSFPYGTTHKVLEATEMSVERICFDFAQKWIPDVLESAGYHYPVAVAITSWPKIFSANRHNLEQNVPNLNYGRLDELLKSMGSMRNIFVHRVQITAAVLSQFVADAVELGDIMDGNERTDSLRTMQKTLAEKVEAIDAHRSLLLAGARVEFEKIHREREERNRKRKELDKRLQELDKEEIEIQKGAVEKYS